MSSSCLLRSRIHLWHLRKMSHPVRIPFAHLLVVGRVPEIATCHFRRAADNVTRSAASFAVNWSTPSANTTVTEAPQQQNSPMANQPGRKYPTAVTASLLQTGRRSVSITTSADPLLSAPMPTELELTSVPSAAPSPTTHLHGFVESSLSLLAQPKGISSLPSPIFSKILHYRDFSNTVAH